MTKAHGDEMFKKAKIGESFLKLPKTQLKTRASDYHKDKVNPTKL